MPTLICSNPNCQLSIEFPEEASYVACPRCNTWHFPDAAGQESAVAPVILENRDGRPDIPVYVPPTDQADWEGGLLQNDETPAEVPVKIASLVLEGMPPFMLKEGKNLIGRKNCDLDINDPTVSRQHCVIEANKRQEGEGWDYIIYDIGNEGGQASTNGVFLSGRTLRLQNFEQIRLERGTEIMIGNVRAILEY